MFENYLLMAISALALFLGLRWGYIGVNSGGFHRSTHPVLFWMGMTLPALGLLTGLALEVTGN